MNEKGLHITDNTNQLTVLIVEDNPGDMFLLEETLRLTKLPFKEILKAHTAADAVAVLKDNQVSVILLDISLPDSSGFNSYSQINDYASAIPIIVLTGLSDTALALETMAGGAQDYLVKGEFDERMLTKSIQYSVERNRIRESLRESNESYRNLFYNNPMPIFIWDVHTFQILEVNDITLHEYGYTRDELLAIQITDLISETDREDIHNIARKLSTTDMTRISAIWHQHKKNGEPMVLDVSSHKIDYKGRSAILAIHNNITEKIKLGEKLEEERLLKQKEIIEATIRAQEKERNEISTELHDNVNQQLTVAMMYIASARQKMPEDSELLKQSAAFVLNAIEEIRKLSQTLVTPLIKHFGLSKAIEGLIDDISAVNTLQIELNADIFEEDDIKYEFKLNLFRIVQELMNNIIKHAQATHVDITIRRSKAKIFFSVADNGIGFDITAQRNGIGIYSIMSRSDLYNGMVDIQAIRGKGCTINITFPLQENIFVQEVVAAE